MTKIDDYDTDSGSFDDRKLEGDGSFEGFWFANRFGWMVSYDDQASQDAYHWHIRLKGWHRRS